MNIREKINENPQIAVAFIIIVAIVAGVMVYMNSGTPGSGIAAKMFYSDDEGKTYFADDTNKIFPFDHNGKKAYRATVMQGNGQPFVAFLTKYSDSVHSQLLALDGKTDPDSANKRATLMGTGIEVKKPGDSQWVSAFSPEGGKVMLPIITDGSPPHEVQP